MGDTFEIRQYERRTPLEIMDKKMQKYSEIESGDCVVAFSRKRIYEVRSQRPICSWFTIQRP